MKLLHILKTIGKGVIREAIPGGNLLVELIDQSLPEKHRGLSKDLTGDQAIQEIEVLLPSQDRAKLLNRELDVEAVKIQESYSTVRAMLEADVKNPQSTRPAIAKGCFHILAICNMLFFISWLAAVFLNYVQIAETLTNGSSVLLTVNGPLVICLMAYFGILRTEHKNRLDAANGVSLPTGLGAIINSLLKR